VATTAQGRLHREVTGPVDAELDERKASILKAIVQDYVREGEPVGSKRLTEAWGLGVSSATVRSEMAALEDAGYIAQPHTSAGRIPTDKGYRYFVDALGEATPLSVEQREALQTVLRDSSDLEELLRRASGVLSRLTRFAALVVAPALDRSRLRHIELVQLGPTSVLAVFIADTGRVEKRMLDLETPMAEHDVARARHAVNDAVAGLRTNQVPDVVGGVAAGAPAEIRPLLDAVAEGVRRGLTAEPGGDQVIVGGTANMAAHGYFDRLEQVKSVYETLEEQVIVLKMLKDTLEIGDPAVRIGAELPLVELAACSVVAASYDAAGSSVGSIGVLGPTRMDYPRTLAVVQAVASSIEEALSGITGGGE
jgi:heat-inducible transcriptional repressor